MRRAKSGYTLIEIIAVIAIIALLAAIVYAAQGSVRSRSKESVCSSNLRQLYAAFTMYRNDYDGTEPQVGVRLTFEQLGFPYFGSTEQVNAFIHDYVKDKRVCVCPDSPPADQQRPWAYSQGFGKDTDPHGSNPVYSEVWYKLGGRSPMLSCENHNPPVKLDEAPRWTTHKVLILRFNGQVEPKTVPLLTYYPFEPLK